MVATTDTAAQFLIRQHQTGSRSWRAMCLSLQRQARGLPAVYPSALTAAKATPEKHRVYKVADLRRGMIAYSDDPNDGNPYGHIYFIAGWKEGSDRTDPADCLTWSNDVVHSGGVDLVPLSFYRSRWGDGFQFGATWLNGYELPEFNQPAGKTSRAKPKPAPGRATLGDNYAAAIEDVEKALRHHRKANHPRLVKALERDLRRMRTRYAKWKA